MAVKHEQENGSLLDDDGRPRRTGTLWSCIAHIITAVIGSGVLSLAWSVAQLGWIAGPIAMLCFAIVTYVSVVLLSGCYRCPDPVTGTRNYSYMDAVRVNLGSRTPSSYKPKASDIPYLFISINVQIIYFL
ncbi:amino acid permease 3-like isoform X2 [Populus alba x Populus x berolinensis]|uniref:Amino acid permease 3-like isoform X2 n=1 Tax=Populus alba x Populus x berolinensis TaxID=444605 RepID=A0AAD6M8E8_9ROSI|nr:amino acid permease 3-like isoform X2 [Populus alba x Populus x berolinensis]